ncbi:uncharacterized protein LOC132194673 [Neocloeon triangulifer]|uniref:uncharacterized protein LOC132194673 n=1 Tax=Neocloeon triangulifer TaxID=2078957 RepID=UPI00286F9453|nr:uncharacterized protein LOC132194673 [Neocloeon triangulifer]
MPLRFDVFLSSILLLVLIQETSQANSRGVVARNKGQGTSRAANKRQTIIKCCGPNKCSAVSGGSTKRRSQPVLNKELNLTKLGNLQTSGLSFSEKLSTTQVNVVDNSDAESSDLPMSTFIDASPNLSDKSTLEFFQESPSSSKSISTALDVQMPSSSSTLKKATPSVSIALQNSETTISNTSAADFPSEKTKLDSGSTTILPETATQISTETTESKILLSTPTQIQTTATTIPTTKTTSTTINPALVGKCSTNEIAAVNRSLFATNGEIADPDLHGFWLDACGQTILLGKSLGTWHENSDKCFGLKMKPFAIESKEKLECMKLQAKSWKFNMNYWTGGAKNLASGTFGWCSANGSAPWQDVLPLANPAKDQNCVQMQISKANGSVSISGKRCSDRTIFACQGPPTKGPKCASPVCPNITCQKDPLLFTLTANRKSMVLKNISLHGKLFTYRLRNYLFSYSSDTRTYLEATKACCDLGMSLLSLDSPRKYDALATIGNISEMSKEAQNLTFWTSGSDEGCESVFGFCSAKRLFRGEAQWLPGQPDNARGKENYVAVHIWRQKGQVLLADYEGQTKFRYICEKLGNPQTKSGKQAMVDECSIIFNVTSTEIDLLRNMTKFDLRIKCFLHCVGDAVGLLVGGNFVASEVFAMLESMNLKNADELMKNMAIVDECNNKTLGMDECDKAYQLTKCARDKSPEVFDQMIKDLDKKEADNDELVSKSYGCGNSSNCTIDVVARDNLTSLNLNASTCVNYINGEWVCKCSNLKMYYMKYQNGWYYDYLEALKFCCERGMRMLRTANFFAAAKCMQAAGIAKVINHPYSNRFWTMTNSLVVDVTSGFSYDCETQTDYLPQNLNPGFQMDYNPRGAYDGGTQNMVVLLDYSAPPKFHFGSAISKQPFICEEIF